jgi:hypothetical protein
MRARFRILEPETFYIASLICIPIGLVLSPDPLKTIALTVSAILAVVGFVTSIIWWDSLGRKRQNLSVVLLVCCLPSLGLLGNHIVSHEAPGELGLRLACQNNLKQIAFSLSMYAGDNNGRLPASLQQLQDKGYMSFASRVYVCRSHWKGKEPTDTLNSSYEYLGAGYNTTMPTNTIIVRDKFKHPVYKQHPAGWNVIGLDFQVRFVSEQETNSPTFPAARQ